jgi:prepilin-type N-terminal cleavage/methylation domain-containing protein
MHGRVPLGQRPLGQRLRARRDGFTLLELVVALSLTAVAATIAGTAVSAARRTEAVVQTHRTGEEADLRLRALLEDMLRHAPPASMTDMPLLSVTGVGDAAVLRFVSRGVVAPFGTGTLWLVTVHRDADSLRVDAETLRDAGEAPLHFALGGVTAFAVRALEGATTLDGARWRGDWPLARVRPAAIALSWTRAGTPVAPFVVALDPLQGNGP